MNNARFFLKDFIRSNSGLIINKSMLRVFGLEMAFFLADLADRDDYFEKKAKEEKIEYSGWFFSTKEYRAEELNVSVKTLQRLMSEAVDAGLVETAMKGHPAKQWVHIDYAMIYAVLTGTKYEPSIPVARHARVSRSSHTSIPVASHTYNNTKDNNTKEDRISLSQSSSATSKDARYVSFAEKLDEICQSYGKKKQQTKTLQQWSRHFRLLHTINKISVQEINKTLEWYSENIGKEYVPEVFCGKTFRDKFEKLQNAINRNKRGTSSSKTIKPGYVAKDHGFGRKRTTFNTDEL